MPFKFKEPKIVRSPDKGITKIESIAKEMNKPGIVKVGLPKNSNPYPDGTSVIMVGAVNEFGSPARGIPERSYLRSTLNKNRRTYKSFLANLGRKVGTGKKSSKQAIGLLGQKVADDVANTLVKLLSPPNAPRTIEEKGSSNPLFDTGHLHQSITWTINPHANKRK